MASSEGNDQLYMLERKLHKFFLDTTAYTSGISKGHKEDFKCRTP